MNWKIVFITIFISSFLITRAVFAYDDKTTHPALTGEVVNFYNLNFNQKITDEEKEWIIEGSILEDTPPRWVNHFYDPIYKVGWTGETAGLNPQDVLRQFTDLFLSNGRAVSALNWVHNQELQNQYKLYRGNQTWEKAIYEYVKNKDKKAAYYALGYVLHLLEDMAVPDHTRDDTHPNDSPYENYATRFTRDTFHIIDNLRSKNYQPTIFNSLDNYFESLAEYSNNYFFSKDTINDAKYNKPKIIKDDGNFAYGIDKNNQFYELAAVDYKKIDEYFFEKIYYIKNVKEYDSILNDYWTRLSREAILGGAGVIDLFFKEAEKAENDPSLLKKPPENLSMIFSLYGEIDKFSNFVNDIYSGINNLANNLWNNLTGSEQAAIVQSLAPTQSTNIENVELAQEPIPTSLPSADAETVSPSLLPPSPQVPVAPPVPPVLPSNPSPQNFTPSLPYPGFGGGGGPAPAPSFLQAPPPPTPLSPAPPPPDTTPPNPPAILSPNNFSQIFISAAIVFSGTAEIQSIISNDFNNSTTTADSGGAWSLALTLNQGTTTIKFFTQDAAGNISSSTDISLSVDSTAPALDSFIISECGQSFSSDSCLTATTTLHLSWQSNAEDLDFFELTIAGQTSNITATSTIVVVQDNSVNTFSIRAKDKAGNWSAPQTVTAEISTMPVVINEVAWGGTAGHPYDEWIELYNRTSKTINLNNWILFSQTDLKPYINLSGTVPAKGYYLIERTDDNTVSDIPADWKGSFGSSEGGGSGLNNVGEVLVLSYAPPVGGQASTTIDQTVLGSNDKWPEGNDSRTMERYDPDLSGNIVSNWSTNNMLIRRGKTAGPQFWDINGTPKARNSVNYLMVKTGSNITSDLTLTKSKSPYIVDKDATVIQAGAALTIEPGVVIKFYGGGMLVFGEIIAEGTTDEPIVFTSFNDDEYGGDTNNDATSTVPIAGSWYGIEILSGDSSFAHTIFRYGGTYYDGMGNTKANLSVKDFPVVITNSVFEYSKVYGLKLINSNSNISNSTFSNNEFGLDSQNSSPTIQSNAFRNNRQGLYLSYSPGTVDNNIFESNLVAGLSSAGYLSDFTNNSGSNNGTNAIVLSGNLTQENDNFVLSPNPLPYSIRPYETSRVAEFSTLTVKKGTIFKSDAYLNIEGNLIIDGEAPSDIIFTSLYDDSIGGDTTNDATSTSPTPGQCSGIRISNTGSLQARGFTMRYCGYRGYGGNQTAAIIVDGAPIEIRNALLDNNYPYGIYAVNSENISIENARFENHNSSAEWGSATALAAFNSFVSLANVDFINNYFGVASDTFSTFTASIVNFINNTFTTSPSGLW